MLSNSQLKLLTALQVKKYRQKYRKFTLEGDKLVAELLAQQRIGVSAIFGLERWAAENAALLEPFLQIFNPVSESELKKASALSTPNRVLAVAGIPEASFSDDLLRGQRCFFLDGLQDPGNLGTILRIADWFGMPAVFCSPDCVDAYSPKVVQASMGAILRIPVFEAELTTLKTRMPELPLAGAVLDGEDVFEAALPPNGLLAIGNEGRGLRPEAETLLDRRLAIPRAPGGRAESLNAAVAAGIFAAVWQQKTGD